MKGHCLCGAVAVESPAARDIGACHCGFCRRWGGGGPMLAVHCGPDVRVDGAGHVGVYASSDWAERAFCRRCGTHLYYRLLSTGDYFVPAGLFDGEAFEITQQLYVDRKPDFYALANRTLMLTEAQVLDLFAPPADGSPG